MWLKRNVPPIPALHYESLSSVLSGVKDVQNVRETVRSVRSAERSRNHLRSIRKNVSNVEHVRVPVHLVRFILKGSPLSDPKVGNRSSYVLLSFRTVNLWGVQDVCGGR